MCAVLCASLCNYRHTLRTDDEGLMEVDLEYQTIHHTGGEGG
jgi:hypothetical protein